MSKIYSSYNDFYSRLNYDAQQMGDLGSYVPQGVCNYKNKTLVTLYDGDKKNKPIVLIIDEYGGKKKVQLNLDEGTHVGGIAYDSNNDKIWITGSKGEVCMYSSDSIINNKGELVTEEYKFNPGITNENGSNVASYLTYHNNKLYVGSFNESSKGTVKEYTLNSNGQNVTLSNEFSVPKKAQGISFYEKNNQTYMAVSCSYGRFSDSKLRIYKYDNGSKEHIETITVPPMLEQVTFNNNGTLKCVFESNAKKYDNGSVRIPAVCSINVL